MGRSVKAVVAAVALTVTLALPAAAGARTKWVCDVPGVGTVTFVSAADAARHGIEQANSTAGVVFHDQFGEECHVE
jgi:ABC-type sugar transport system substrate-binding protein